MMVRWLTRPASIRSLSSIPPSWCSRLAPRAAAGGSGGLALALAPALLARGAKLAMLDVNQDAVERAATSLGGTHVARGWQADVRDFGRLEIVMAEVAAHLGRLDVIMANAAIGGAPTALADVDPLRREQAVDVNLNGVYRTFRAALPHVSRQGGHLLAKSSMAAFVHGALQGSYTAVKAGIWALCDTWRLDLRHTGVSVGSLHPTFFKTPLMDAVMADPAGERIWGGNKNGAWKLIPIELVVTETIRGIERRERQIFAPPSVCGQRATHHSESR